MKRMKRKKGITIIAVSVVVVAMAAAGYLYTKGFFGGGEVAAATIYTLDGLTTGDIVKSVTGTGTLAASGDLTVTVPVNMRIESVAVTAGEQVKAGDTLATVDAQSLADTVEALKSEISSIDSSLAKLASSETSVAKLTSQVSGRVKQILCAAGGGVEDTMLQSGGLFVLSTDGKMKVDITLAKANGISSGAKVKVAAGGSTYTGLVECLSDDGRTATVTLTDNGPALGAAAIVYTASGTELGTGKLAINRPYSVTATAGTVSKIYVDLNDQVSTRTALAYLTGIPVSAEQEALVQSRANAAAQLATATALQQTCTLTAPQDGVVSTISVAAGRDASMGATLITMLTTDTIELDVSVDELDINSISTGQTATIEIDALTGQTFTGAVKNISQIGNENNGVTTYDVAIQIPENESLKIGMNATATIVIDNHTGVLLLPLEALNTSQGESYVWLYTGSLPADDATDPGMRTVVTTGLSNADFVEITKGLEAGDQVVVVRPSSSSLGSASGQSGMNMNGLGGITGLVAGG